MAKEPAKGSVEALATPAEELREQTIIANLMMGNDKTVNTYKVRNDRALSKAKSLVCYKNGITRQRMSVKRLEADARSKGSHSQALSGNIQLARGEFQADATDAHHIVARRHRLAAVARGFLFRWKIGIDDADNGRAWRRPCRIARCTAAPTISRSPTGCANAWASRNRPRARSCAPCGRR
jgi:hypothetical protein